eukprot:TRINITY_DN55773_c0_g2_i1.p2 TRINITY_DN55773_c0_g2~~TRINITY_DN55773_c0_g2_i1.p2  ORF type:complete len:105 (-),score=1.93 TRINITY_DN55773_c0_g2_i1:58-372(-)
MFTMLVLSVSQEASQSMFMMISGLPKQGNLEKFRLLFAGAGNRMPETAGRASPSPEPTFPCAQAPPHQRKEDGWDQAKHILPTKQATTNWWKPGKATGGVPSDV